MIIRSKQFAGMSFGLMVASTSVMASANFTAQDIKIEGLSGIGSKTVLNYLPLKRGQTVTTEKTREIIKALYKTGFFRDIKLHQRGNVLVIQVVERPTIGVLTVRGNKDIPRDKLLEVLDNMGIKRGRIYNKAQLTQLINELKHEYSRRGKYNAIIGEEVTELTGNRVAVKITISEGRVALIKRINFFGNKQIASSVLRKEMSLSESNSLTYVTKKDQFTDYALQQSLESVRAYYHNHGFIKAEVLSNQVLLTPDKKEVFINIRVKEGHQYHFSGGRVEGNSAIKKYHLDQQLEFHQGELFSRELVQKSIANIGNVLGDNGYGFPKISAEPIFDEQKKTIFIKILVDPGRTVYVRRINFNGNTKTADPVLRHIIKQNEASVLSLKNINESLRQLRTQGYLKNVSYKNTPVPGTNNQVDLDFSVEESPTAEASAAIGYGTNGPEVKAGFNQKNFMGTGKEIGINFSASYWGENYSVSYYNPLYTKEGIGRGFNLYYQTVDPSKLDITTYSSDKLGAEVNYNIPLSHNTNFQIGAGLEHLKITSLGSTPASPLQNFVDRYGNQYDEARVTLGFHQNTYDQLPFPTKGYSQQASLLLATPFADGVSYYKSWYVARGYYPLIKGFILSGVGRIGYGNQFDGQGLPFFENFFAGGIAPMGMVRGYDTYSLGPKDNLNNAIGGNYLVSGTLALIMPYPLSRESVRTSVFVDAGNVYAKNTPAQYKGSSSGDVRASAGVAVDWRSPMGPLSFSLGWDLNAEPGDRLTQFQFTVTSSV